jgi:hypothetical protein
LWNIQTQNFYYPACKANMPYCIVIWGLSGISRFPTLCHKRYDFRRKKKVTKHKMRVLIFSTNSLRNIFHSTRNQRKTIINLHGARYSCQILMKLDLSRRTFEKNNTQTSVHEQLCSGSGVVARGQMHGHRQTDRQTCRS